MEIDINEGNELEIVEGTLEKEISTLNNTENVKIEADSINNEISQNLMENNEIKVEENTTVTTTAPIDEVVAN